MIEINEISKIGFGTYRIKKGNSGHEDSLSYALKNGFNLIDTASSYGMGDSESLIGKILNDTKKSDYSFVISKAGYIFNSNKELLNLLSKNEVLDQMVELTESHKHSIHPIYLKYELNKSLKRLKRNYVDCYMLHNPEYHLKNGEVSEDEYYERIFNAFQFLESKVEEGLIRYYGISSNTFPFSEEESNTTKLNRIIDVANRVSSKHHFRFIQFPFNLVENSAILNHHYNNDSLVSLAKKNNIITLSNRPLNANSPRGILRLASYNVVISENELLLSMENMFSVIKHKLDEEGRKENITDFEVFDFVQKEYEKIDNHKKFNQLNSMILSFVEVLYGNNIPQESNTIMQIFLDNLEKWSKRQSTIRAKNLLNSLNVDYSNMTVSSLVINTYLSNGIDHVLCGMKKREYVDDLINLL